MCIPDSGHLIRMIDAHFHIYIVHALYSIIKRLINQILITTF